MVHSIPLFLALHESLSIVKIVPQLVIIFHILEIHMISLLDFCFFSQFYCEIFHVLPKPIHV